MQRNEKTKALRAQISKLVEEYAAIALAPNPFVPGAEYRISGDLTNTDKVMNSTFWIGVQPSLTKEMLEFSALKIGTFLGVIGVK